MDVTPEPEKRNKDTSQTPATPPGTDKASLPDTMSKLDPDRTQTEILVAILLEKLPSKISQQFPELFPTPPQISRFDGSGVTAIPFELVSKETGTRSLLKLRPYLDSEVRDNNPVEALKESWVRNQADQAGVPVARGGKPFILSADELPRSLDAIKVRFGGLVIFGRERPYVLGIQEFVDGAPARLSIQDNQVQLTAQKELGEQLRKLHTVGVRGYGGDFNPSTESFSKSWAEYREAFQTLPKAKELQLRGILSEAEVKAIERLVRPLNDVTLPPVLLHQDVNHGNYMIRANGHINAILDWDEAKGGPWQHDIAEALCKVEASSFGIPRSSIPSRIAAFLDGYGLSREELKREKPIIDAFRATVAVGALNAFYLDYGYTHSEGEYRSISDANYVRKNKRTKEIIPDSETDFSHGLLGFEHVLKSLMSNTTLEE